MRKSIFVILVAAIVFLGGCSGGSDDGTVTTPSGVTTLSCSALSLGTASAESLHTVSISGIPQEMGEPYLLVSTLDESNVTFSVITKLEDNSTAFFSPLYPGASPADGGEVMLELTDGTYSCSPQQFTVVALPTTDVNVTAEVASSLQTNLDLMYTDAGTDMQSMRDVNFTTMPHEHFPLYLAQRYLDYYVDEMAKLTPSDRELVNRIMAQTGMNEELQAFALNYEPTSLVIVTPSLAPKRSPLLAGEVGTCRIFSSDALVADISTAAQLSAAMQKQNDAQNTIDNTKALFNVVNYGAIAGGVLLGPAGAAVAAGVGAVSMATSIALDNSANMNPSNFGVFTFEITNSGMFNEDYEGSPVWSQAKINASSNGWNLTKPMIDIVLAGIGAVASKVIDVSSTIYKAVVAADGVVKGEINNHLAKEKIELECLQIDPHTWGPIDVTSPSWVYTTYYGTAVQESSTYGFNLVQTGDASLSLTIIKEQFGGNFAEQERSIRVEEKMILTTASKTVVDKNEEITVIAEMYNTDYPDTEPLWEIGAATEMSRNSAGSSHTIVLKMPNDDQLFPITVTATSQTKDLPISGQAKDSVLLKLADVEIQPRGLCVQPGQSATVTATTQEGKILDWSVTGGGDITPSATSTTHVVTYTAPPTKGEYTITAVFSDDTSVNDEINVTVGNCVEIYVFGGASASIDPPQDDCMNYGHILTSDNMEFATPEPYPLPPLKPDTEVWQGKEEYFTFNATENYHGSRLVNDVCNTFNLPATSNAEIAYISDTEGNITLTMDMSYSYECSAVGDETECSNVSGGAAMSAHHYIDIHQAGDYTLSFDLECTPVSSDADYYAGSFPLQIGVSLFRYLSTTGEPVDANHCSLTEDCTPDQIVSPGVVNLQNICEPGTETVHINIPIALRGPIDPQQADTLYMFTSVITGAPSQDYMNFLMGPAVTSGSHNGSVQFNMSAKLAPSN